MSEITAIEPQKHDKARCNIFVDGRFCCGMGLETVIKNRLKTGSVVTTEELARLQLDSEKQTAFDKALTHISASMKTEREVREFLEKKGYLRDVSDYVIEKMKGYGFLDDAAYAHGYTEQMSARKGGRLIAAELKRKGVSEQAIESALDAMQGETEAATRILEKYLRGKDITDKKVIQRAYAHLISKGFDYDTARDALKAYADAGDAGES